jgi:hypothetical protein
MPKRKIVGRFTVGSELVIDGKNSDGQNNDGKQAWKTL